MSTARGDRSELARLVGLAARAEPPPIDDLAARRLVECALGDAAGLSRGIEARSPARRAGRAFAFACALAAAVVVGWLLRPVPDTERAPEAFHLALPTGDRLVATDRAGFEVARLDPDDRRITLGRGTLLADVAHVTARQHFEIATPHLVAIAKGTVFSVETDARRSRVQVYEGVVEVIERGTHHAVSAGHAWTSGTSKLARVEPESAPAAIEPPVALVADIDVALVRRATRLDAAPATPTPTPTPTPTTTAATMAPAPAPTPTRSARASSSPDEVRRTLPDRIPVAAPKATLDHLLADAHAALAGGRPADALAIAKRAVDRGASSSAWQLVEADALRGLGRAADAAAAYEVAARSSIGTTSIEAAYSAAYLYLRSLHDPAAAITVLSANRVDASGSPLEERGLALHVRALVAVRRPREAIPLAKRYLAHFPSGELRAEMTALAGSP